MRRFPFLLSIILLLCIPTLLPQQALAGGCESSTSLCVQQTLPPGAKPGQTCGNQKNYTYGYSYTCFGGASPCIPSCGPGNYWCCDPKPNSPAASNTPAGAPKTSPPPCAGSTKNGCDAVTTALGNISTKPELFVRNLYGLLLSLSGGIALFLIIASGYQLMVSQGNPEKVKEARERLTAAIIGFIFIIFAVTILQIIGVQILQLPGLK